MFILGLLFIFVLIALWDSVVYREWYERIGCTYFIAIDPASLNVFENGMLIDVNNYTAVVVAKHYRDGTIEIIEIEGVN